jgi:hypothetical protein
LLNERRRRRASGRREGYDEFIQKWINKSPLLDERLENVAPAFLHLSVTLPLLILKRCSSGKRKREREVSRARASLFFDSFPSARTVKVFQMETRVCNKKKQNFSHHPSPTPFYLSGLIVYFFNLLPFFKGRDFFIQDSY